MKCPDGAPVVSSKCLQGPTFRLDSRRFWDLVFVNYSLAHMCSQKPKAACPLFWRKPEPPELHLPGCLSISMDW